MARPIAQDHSQKRAAILRAAAQVLAQEGVARASMAQVAAACGISKANIYHYYGSKEALLFDILDTYLSALRDRICGLASEATLHDLTREILLAYEGMDAEHKIQSEVMPLLPDAQQGILRAHQRDMVQRMEAALLAAAPDLGDPREAAMSVFGMLNWFYMWKPRADAQDRERYARSVANLTLGGVGAL
ncbi:MAG: TetR/AcrR family transcriptional regulator [Pseudomonadota bacterium]